MERRYLLRHLIASFVMCEACTYENNAPDFSLADNNGQLIRLRDFRGKVVLLNFWATWCDPCKVEFPWFVQFAKDYEGDGFAVIGVSFDEEGWNTVLPFLSRYETSYPVVLADGTVDKIYNVKTLPTTILIDRTGQIVSVHVGLVDKDTIETQIKAALGATI